MRPLQNQPQFDAFPSYKGGHTTLYGSYVWEFSPGHHLQNNWGWVAQHRLVGEDLLGRLLKKGEHVHHIDGNKINNNLSNLQVISVRDHRKLHYQLPGWNKAPITREQVIEALEGRSLKNAARLLHVDTMTLRNRFPDLINARKRKSPVVIDKDTVKKAILMMKSGKYQAKEICSALGIGHVTLVRIGKRNFVSPRWKIKSKVGELKKTYRGKPTRRWLEMNGQLPASAV